MKKRTHLKGILYALTATFILIVTYFLLPSPEDLKRTLFPLVAVLGFVFLALGIVLIFLSRKEKGKLKGFLLLTGLSAVAPFAGSILHNLFYGLGEAFTALIWLFGPLHAAFFIIALLIAPILFIIGITGCTILLCKK